MIFYIYTHLYVFLHKFPVIWGVFCLNVEGVWQSEKKEIDPICQEENLLATWYWRNIFPLLLHLFIQPGVQIPCFKFCQRKMLPVLPRQLLGAVALNCMGPTVWWSICLQKKSTLQIAGSFQRLFNIHQSYGWRRKIQWRMEQTFPEPLIWVPHLYMGSISLSSVNGKNILFLVGALGGRRFFI